MDPDIQIDGNNFCITGKLTRGNRKDLIQQIENQGGKFVSQPSKRTNFLIVGDNGNPAWAFSCYGRKVEEAIKLRKKGENIILVHEHDFWDHLDDVLN